MNLGDHVLFSGVVKDKVEVQATGQRNALVGSDTDGREFWFPEDQLKGVPTATELEAMATAAGYKLEKIPPATTPAPPAPTTHTAAGKH